MRLSILLTLILILNSCSAQKSLEVNIKPTEFDSIKHNSIFQIDIVNYQMVQLIEYQNGEFQGSLSHSVWKTNRKEEQKEKITQKIKTPNVTVEKLIRELRTGGIENLKDCEEVEGCIIGLDGTTISFSIHKNGINKSASYWELKSDYYYKTNSVKIPSEVHEARKLFSIVDNKIDFKKQFENFITKLPIGKYMYNGIIMEKKKNVW